VLLEAWLVNHNACLYRHPKAFSLDHYSIKLICGIAGGAYAFLTAATDINIDGGFC
jgi:hypothetical protein